MSISTLDTGTKVFLLAPAPRRRRRGSGREAERRAGPDAGRRQRERRVRLRRRESTFMRAFRDGVQPELDFRAGREVTELLMACYMSAEQERVIDVEAGRLVDLHAAGRPAGGCRMTIGRRDWLRQMAAASPGLACAVASCGATPDSFLQGRPTPAASSGQARVRGVTLGVQSYSFRDRPLDGAHCGDAAARPDDSCELWQGHVEPREVLTRGDAAVARDRAARRVPSRSSESSTAPASLSTPTTSASKMTSATPRSRAASRWPARWAPRSSPHRRGPASATSRPIAARQRCRSACTITRVSTLTNLRRPRTSQRR